MKTVFDMSKVCYMTYYYEDTLHQYTRTTLPNGPTLYNEPITDDNIYKLARLKGLVDEWVAKVKITFSNGHQIICKGQRAINIWKEWNKRQFAKRKGK